MAKPGELVRSPTSINIDRELWKEFKMECARTGRTATDQLERLIASFLKTHKVKSRPQSK